MAVNKFFHDGNKTSIATERTLYSDLVKEAIQIFGHDCFYLNRTIMHEDDLFGEDKLTKFQDSQRVEMYVEDADGGLQGEKELVSKFGLDIKDEITFVVNKERFQDLTKQIAIEEGTDDGTGGSILLEDGTLDSKIEAGTSYITREDSVTDADRPLEGDLVFHPVINKMFEISFVDHDEPFFQLDNNPVYKLKCRLFEYGSEDINTGISTLDNIDDVESLDTLNHQFTLEQSSTFTEEIALEDGNLLLLDRTDSDGTDAGDNLITETQFGATSVLLETTDTYYMIVKNPSGVFEEGDVITTSGGATATITLIEGNIFYYEYINGQINKDDVITSRSTAYTATVTSIKEDNHYLINEVFDMETQDEKSQNDLFERLDNTILDFSESNPFGDAGKEA